MNHEYQILQHSIGKGSFGIVYLGLHKKTGQLVAIKTEKKGKKNFLIHENNIMRYACSLKNNKNIPAGTVNSIFFWEDLLQSYLVTNLLGPSIDSLHTICGRSFSLKTTLMLTEQMLGLIKYYHEHNIVHRDIKPSNFLVSYELPHKNIHLIDFGLAKKYKVHNVIIPCASGVPRVGSLRYMSKYVHNSIEPTCRDDMYSLGYCIIYLFTGSLPWRGLSAPDKKDRHTVFGKLKWDTSNADLVQKCKCIDCKHKPCYFHKCMLEYFNYLDTLEYGEEINYNYLIKEIITCFKEHGFTYDYKWDWNKYYVTGS
jgi:casein kinase 1